jgi:ABC-type multidrug transport system fused ATPase/permease subunit
MQQLYRYIWAMTSHEQILLVVLSAMISVLAMVPLEFQRHVINSLAYKEHIEKLALLCGGYFLASLAITGLKWRLNLKTSALGETTVRNLREVLYDRHSEFRADVSEANSRTDQTGTLVTMISAEADKLGNFAGEAISTPLVQIGTLISVLTYMLATAPRLGVVVLILAMPQAVLAPVVQKTINVRVKERVKSLRAANDLIVSAVHAPAQGENAGIAAAFDTILQNQLRIFRLKYGSRALINAFNTGAAVTILFVGGWMVIDGRTEIGIVVAFLSGLDKIVEPSRELIAFFRTTSSITVQFELISDALHGKLRRLRAGAA